MHWFLLWFFDIVSSSYFCFRFCCTSILFSYIYKKKFLIWFFAHTSLPCFYLFYIILSLHCFFLFNHFSFITTTELITRDNESFCFICIYFFFSFCFCFFCFVFLVASFALHFKIWRCFRWFWLSFLSSFLFLFLFCCLCEATQKFKTFAVRISIFFLNFVCSLFPFFVF